MSLKLPRPMANRLAAAAKKRRSTMSAVAREALDLYLNKGPAAPKVSCYDLTRHLAGTLEGPPDLATNPKYMRGYGR